MEVHAIMYFGGIFQRFIEEFKMKGLCALTNADSEDKNQQAVHNATYLLPEELSQESVSERLKVLICSL